jgi:hypothetical protein
MPKPYFPTQINGRRKGDENELMALIALHKFGHLRRRELGRLLWPATSQETRRKMAERVVRRLRHGMLIEGKQNMVNEQSFLLTSRGAKRLNQLRAALGSCSAGADLTSVKGKQFFHRMLGANYLITRANQGDAVFSELDITRGLFPVSRSSLEQRYAKVPDAFVVHGHGRLTSVESLLCWSPEVYPAAQHSVDWVEVEQAYKSKAELRNIFTTVAVRLGATMTPENADEKDRTIGPLVMNRLLLVYDVLDGHEARILEALQEFLDELHFADEAMLGNFLDDLVLVRCVIDKPYVWVSSTEVTAHELFNGHVKPLRRHKDAEEFWLSEVAKRRGFDVATRLNLYG